MNWMLDAGCSMLDARYSIRRQIIILKQLVLKRQQNIIANWHLN